MEKDDKKTIRKSIRKTLDAYLKKPSRTAADELRKNDYLPVLEKRLPKIGPKAVEGAIDLLAGDESDQAADLLTGISGSGDRAVSVRLKAFKALESRGAEFDRELQSALAHIERIAASDDADGAAKLYPGLSKALMQAFADAVVEHKSAGALKAAADASTEKGAIKILRKAAHTLSGKGVDAGEISEKGKAVYRPLEKEKPRAKISHMDGMGKQMVIMALPSPGGVHIFQGILDEEEGLVDFQGVDAGRRGAHTFIKRLTEHIGIVDVDTVYATHLLDKAAARAAEKNNSIPSAYTEQHFMLPKIPTGYEPPNPRGMLKQKPAVADAGESAKLFEAPEIATWLPPEDNLRELQLKLDEIHHSKIIINEGQKIQQIDKAFMDAARKYLTPEIADNLARRLELSSSLFSIDNKADLARMAIAAADGIMEYSGAGKQDDREAQIPGFVVEMFKRIFPDAHKHDHDHGNENKNEEIGSGIIT